jgi:hypothetical protein
LAQSQQELVNAMKADYTQQLDGNTPNSQMISTEKKTNEAFF